MLKKRWSCFRLLAAAAAIPAAAAAIWLPWQLSIAAETLFLLLLVWWSLYYYSLEYYHANNTICIRSGIVFRKHRIIPLGNILWIMRLKMPFSDEAAITFLHTAGGTAVIFADLSTTS